MQYNKTNVRDDPQGSAAVDKFQGKVRGTYITNLKEKDREHFGTAGGNRGPLESLFRHVDFIPLVFGTFGQCSSKKERKKEIPFKEGILKDIGAHVGYTVLY